MGKREIGNVMLLDIRKATEQSVVSFSDTHNIGNVVRLIYSPETAAFISRLNIGNIANFVEVSADAKILNYSVEITRDYFEGRAVPMDIVITGELIVYPDVPIEEIQQGISSLEVVGKVICPKHLIGAIEGKLSEVTGKVQTYIQCDRLFTGQLILDKHSLNAIEDDSVLVVLRDLKIPKVLPTELLEQKIQKHQVLGGIVCHEENAAILLSRSHHPGVAIKTIPAGFEFVERPLVLDTPMLDALESRKLYCTERVQIAPDVEADTLDAKLEALIAEDIVLCPIALTNLLSSKCNVLETQTLFYEGMLWIVEGGETLLPTCFDCLGDRVTLMVTGGLDIDPAVSPHTLSQRLVKIHNLGCINCTPEQMGVIQSRLGIQEGMLIDSTAVEKNRHRKGIGNMVSLVL